MGKKVYTAKDIEYLQLLAQDCLSLNTIVGSGEDDQDTELGDLLQDRSPGPEELAINSTRLETLREFIKKLSPREEMIITMRFGLNSQETMTLDEIGKEFGVTRERIRQVEAKAIRKLKAKFKQLRLKEEDM